MINGALVFLSSTTRIQLFSHPKMCDFISKTKYASLISKTWSTSFDSFEAFSKAEKKRTSWRQAPTPLIFLMAVPCNTFPYHNTHFTLPTGTHIQGKKAHRWMPTYAPNTYHLSLQTFLQHMCLLLLLHCLLADL